MTMTKLEHTRTIQIRHSNIQVDQCTSYVAEEKKSLEDATRWYASAKTDKFRKIFILLSPTLTQNEIDDYGFGVHMIFMILKI